MAPRPVVGIDENGLGPRMGPLVVTGVRLRFAEAAPTFEPFREATGLDDSKRIFSPARRSRGEAMALAVLGARAESAEGRLAQRRGDAEGAATTLHDLLADLAVQVPWAPPLSCPDALGGAYGRCAALAAAGGPIPRWPPGTKDEGRATRNAPAPAVGPGLRRLGITIERVAVAVLCPGGLNGALGCGGSKLAIDLRLFEVVATELRREAGEDVDVACGKVGGTDRYAERFVEWAGREVRTVVESRARSAYDVAGIGRVSFVRDGDATEPATAIASVVGKYVRELWMDDLARAVGWSGPTPSGYHDEASRRLERRAREAIATGTCRLPKTCVRRAK